MCFCTCDSGRWKQRSCAVPDPLSCEGKRTVTLFASQRGNTPRFPPPSVGPSPSAVRTQVRKHLRFRKVATALPRCSRSPDHPEDSPSPHPGWHLQTSFGGVRVREASSHLAQSAPKAPYNPPALSAKAKRSPEGSHNNSPGCNPGFQEPPCPGPGGAAPRGTRYARRQPEGSSIQAWRAFLTPPCTPANGEGHSSVCRNPPIHRLGLTR